MSSPGTRLRHAWGSGAGAPAGARFGLRGTLVSRRGGAWWRPCSAWGQPAACARPARPRPYAATLTQPGEVGEDLWNALVRNLGDPWATQQLADADCRAVLLGGQLLHLLERRAAGAGASSEREDGAALAAGLGALQECWDVVPAGAVAEALSQVRAAARGHAAPAALPGVPCWLAAPFPPRLGASSRPRRLCLQTEQEATEMKQLLGVLQEASASRSARLPPVAAGALLLLLRLCQGLPPYAARAAAALQRSSDSAGAGSQGGHDSMVADYLHEVGDAAGGCCPCWCGGAA